MRVILLEDVPKTGRRYEVKEVADGFARNFLFPRGLAKIANQANLEWLEDQKERINEQAEQALKKTGDLVSRIDGREIEIAVKVGDKGQFFEKIDQKDIAKRLKESGYDIDPKQIQLEALIEELGEYPAKVKFEHNLEAEIKVIVVEETSNNKQ